MCRQYHALPEAGSIMDQDAQTMYMMNLFGNIYDTVQRVRGLTGDAIHNMRPDDGRMLAWLDAVGVKV